MSLHVSPALVEQAERGPINEAAFVDTIRTSLPYAWQSATAEKPGWALCRGDQPTEE